ILEFANEKGLFVIEDCAQAHGGRFNEKPLGSFGHISAFSFCQDKIMTTAGEGGMVVTNDTELWQRAWSFKDHGKDWDLVNAPSDGTYRFLHTSFGTNFRMTEIQAAVGRIQLQRLDTWHAERHENARFLSEGLRNCPGLTIFEPPSYCEHAYYRLYGYIQEEKLKSGWTRDQIIKVVREKGFNLGSGSCAEIYREDAFKKYGKPIVLENAQKAQKNSLAFSVHPFLEKKSLEELIQVLVNVFNDAIETDFPDVGTAHAA
ncbi:MAG: DegT/DnrJ/EryC1/StrS family aminotransferase, partial [Pirellulales bacterium]